MSTDTPLVPVTLLGAINILLKAIRVGTVNSLALVDTNKDASEAKQALDEVAIEVLSKGWYFNTEYEYTIDPAVDGTLTLPANTLKVKSIRCEPDRRLVDRGLRLYDNKEHTYEVGRSAEVDIVVGLPFSEMPQSARAYITALAARRFCIPKLPATATFQYTEEMVRAAYNQMEEADTEQRDDTVQFTSPHFQKMARR